MKRFKYILLMSIIAVLTFVLGCACADKKEYGTVKLDKKELTLTVGESEIITTTTSKADVRLEWSATDAGIVNVYNGLVKATAMGTTTVVATIEGSKTKATCKVTVKARTLENLENIRAYVGDEDISLALNVSENYQIKAEKLEKGVYSDASALLKGVKFSTDEAGSYRITYTAGNETANCYVYVDAEKDYKDFFVIDALDGSTEFKSHVSQSSVDVLTEPECGTTYSQYVEEDFSAELAAAGYDGVVDNNMLYRIEKEVVKFGWGGTYFYFDITPKNSDIFNEIDTFDEGAYLSLWYRVLCDTDGTGYKPVSTSYNYLYRENASGLSLVLRNKSVNALPSNNGWFNWRLSLSAVGELIGSERLIFNIGQWAAGGKFKVDLYSVEVVSPLVNTLESGREVYEGERLEYELPNPGMRNESRVLEGIYKGDTKLEEETDYNFYDYAGVSYIVDLAPGEYTLKYVVSADGLKANTDNGYVIESPLTVKARIYSNPAVFAGNEQTAEDVSWFQAGSWGTLSSANATTVETITDEDYAALKAAGYKGVLNKRTVNRANIKATSVNGDKTRGAFGFIFNLTQGNRLFTMGSDANVKNNYYISIWARANELIGADTRLAAYDTSSMKQATAGSENWVNLNANQWTEYIFPIENFQSVNFWLGQNGGSNGMLGIYLASIFAKNDMYVDIYSAELCMKEVEIEEGKSLDAKFYSGALAVGTALDYIDVYSGSTLLTEGTDYTLENNEISGLTKGEYEIRYYVSGANYLENCYVKRLVSVVKPIENAVVISNMSTANAGTAYVHSSSESIKTSEMDSSINGTVYTLTSNDTAALKTAGYNGVVTNDKANRFTFGTYSAKQYVYLPFNEGYDNEILFEAIKTRDAQLYVSVWMRASKDVSAEALNWLVMGERSQRPANAGWTPKAIQAGEWFEWTMVFAGSQSFGYTYGWGLGEGYYTSAESVTVGLLFYGMPAAGLSGLELDIYSVEFKVPEIIGTQGVATNVSIPSVYGSEFDLEIYNGETKLKKGTDWTMAGESVTIAAAGEYTLVYTLKDDKFAVGQTLKRHITVQAMLASATMIDDMSTAGTVKGWTEPTVGCTRLLNNCTAQTTSSGTISDAEYAALLAAGYKGEKTSKSVSKLTIGTLSARSNLYVQFDATLNSAILNLALANRLSDVYVSVWLKCNQSFSYDTYAVIFGQSSKYAALQDIAPVIGGSNTDWLTASTVGQWMEIQIPISTLLNTSWYEGQGLLTAGEAYAYGFNLWNGAFNGYLSGATFDIWSMELVVMDKTATAGTATDVSIPAALFGTYTVSVLDSEGNPATDVTVSGTSVTATTAGTYTIVYTMTSDRFKSGVTVKAKLTVS
ncbi:MAG: hypothetical protein IJY62_05870 [Clostridia bacterium]|nr:hypothetical protein [Clostridia bacterium]